jgi:hypothetical protein
MARKRSGLCHLWITDTAYGSFRPTASPNDSHPPGPTVHFPQLELTRLRRRTDIKPGKGGRRVGARGQLKGGLLMTRTRSPPTQHSSKQAEQA